MANPGRPNSHPQPFKPPASIDTIIDNVDGQPVTVADRAIEYIRTGQFIELAAAAVGVHKESLYNWLRNAARTRLRAKGRPLNELDLSDFQWQCLDFSDRCLQAAAQWATDANNTLDVLCKGGVPVTKITVSERFKIGTNGEEILVERLRVTTTETTLPDKNVLMWRLERRHTPFFGKQVKIETSGADAAPKLPDVEIAESLGDAVEEWMRDREQSAPPGSVETQVAEVATKPTADVTVAVKSKGRRARDERGRVIDDDGPHPNGNQ